MEKINSLIKQLTLQEKIELVTGFQSWMTYPVKRLNIPSIIKPEKLHDTKKSTRVASAWQTAIVFAFFISLRFIKYAVLAIAIKAIKSAGKIAINIKRIKGGICAESENGDIIIESAHSTHSTNSPPNKPTIMGEITGIIFFIGTLHSLLYSLLIAL